VRKANTAFQLNTTRKKLINLTYVMAFHIKLNQPKGNCITQCTFSHYLAHSNEMSLQDWLFMVWTIMLALFTASPVHSGFISGTYTGKGLFFLKHMKELLLPDRKRGFECGR